LAQQAIQCRRILTPKLRQQIVIDRLRHTASGRPRAAGTAGQSPVPNLSPPWSHTAKPPAPPADRCPQVKPVG
jgi:hypothetical protein